MECDHGDKSERGGSAAGQHQQSDDRLERDEQRDEQVMVGHDQIRQVSPTNPTYAPSAKST